MQGLSAPGHWAAHASKCDTEYGAREGLLPQKDDLVSLYPYVPGSGAALCGPPEVLVGLWTLPGKPPSSRERLHYPSVGCQISAGRDPEAR
jgi:hypothetical protein